MATRDEISPEVSRILDCLELLIATKKLGIRKVERHLQVGKGTLNRFFTGRIDLRLGILFQILELVEITPQDFFSLVFPNDGSAPSKEAMLRSLQSVALPRTPPPSVLTREELKLIVQEVLSEVPAANRGTEKTPSPPKRTPRPRSSRPKKPPENPS